MLKKLFPPDFTSIKIVAYAEPETVVNGVTHIGPSRIVIDKKERENLPSPLITDLPCPFTTLTSQSSQVDLCFKILRQMPKELLVIDYGTGDYLPQKKCPPRCFIPPRKP